MSTPELDRIAAVESALSDFRIFLDMGIVVNQMFDDTRTAGAIELIREEFDKMSDTIKNA